MYENVSFIEEEAVKPEVEKKPVRKQFAIWEVGGQEYKMKLRTANIIELENKLKRNLLSVIAGAENLPPLAIMLEIAHAALKDWNAGMTRAKTQAMFDQYCDEGGDQTYFFTKVIMDIFQVSGFFPKKQSEKLEQTMKEAREELQ